MLLGGCCPQPILLNAPCHAEVDQMTEVIRKRERSTERIEYGEALSVIQKCMLGSVVYCLISRDSLKYWRSQNYRELGEITDIRQDFFKSYSPKKNPQNKTEQKQKKGYSPKPVSQNCFWESRNN